MTGSRAFLILPLAAWLGGCAGFTPAADPPPAEQARLEKDHIFFPGHFPAQLQSAKRIGTASGLSCRENLLGTSPTVEYALKDLWTRAAGQGATAVIDVACYETGMIAAYETSPLANRTCWPGFVCKGDAIK